MFLRLLYVPILVVSLSINLGQLLAEQVNKQPRENTCNLYPLESAKNFDLDAINDCLCIIKDQNKDLKEYLEDHDEAVEEDFELLCSKIESLDQDLSFVEALLCDKIESSSNLFLSELDVTESILCVKIENINQETSDFESSLCEKIESISNVQLSELDVTESVLCSKIELLDQNMFDIESSLCEKIESISNVQLSELDVTESVLCSKIELLDQNIFDIESSLCEKIESISNVQLSELDVTESVLCSKINDLDFESCCSMILSEIDLTESVICNKIETLDVSSSSCCCDVLITQDMLPFTTTADGLVYCLAESVTITSNQTAITVAHDNVVIDLCGHTISTSGIPAGTTGIFATAVNNLTIKNGAISNIRASGITITNSSNIFIDNIHVSYPSNIGIFIENTVVGKISSCTVNGRGSFQFTTESARFILSDCLAIGGGYQINAQTEDICMFNCKSVDSSASGFLINGNANKIICNSCIALSATSNGFEIIEEEDTPGCGFTFKDCIAKSCGSNGFFVADYDLTGISIRNCIANCNGADGFFVGGTTALDILNLIFVSGSTGEMVGCTATENGDDGVDIESLRFRVFNTHSFRNGTLDFGGNGIIGSIINTALSLPTATYWANIGTLI